MPVLPSPSPVRARLKAAAERLALDGGLAAASRARMRGGALVLAYHNVVPHGQAPAGDRSLHLPQAAFAAHLDALARTHDVVPLPALLGPPAGPRPRAAITFDDAYRGALTAGVAELAARGLPATFFVVAGRVGGEGFWWDALTPELRAAPPAGLRAEALGRGRGEDAAVRAIARRRGVRGQALPAHAAPADEAELRAAAAVPGMTLGSHSWSHPNLARLPRADVERELRASLEWLRARFPAAFVPWLAYPYGLSSPEVARAAAECGYAGGLRIDGGWVRGAVDAFAVPRVNVPAGLSARGLALRAAGLLCG